MARLISFPGGKKNQGAKRSRASFSDTRLIEEIRAFSEFKKKTKEFEFQDTEGGTCPVFVNEFWTAKQRAAHSLHEISYRACFKPQLPRFFISRLTKPGDIVYDPFMGRGTTLLEAALLGRIPYGCDVNPLSEMLIRPRLEPPTLVGLEKRLSDIPLDTARSLPEHLLVFYHKDTLVQLCSLRNYLLRRKRADALDRIDRFIWMVALNRLTGHSPGFFSVYTLPPNQAVSSSSQAKINRKRRQRPEAKDIASLILKKSKQLFSEVDSHVRNRLQTLDGKAKLLIGAADSTPQIPENSVKLVVTSPPFLDVVDYVQDNWLRAWFSGIRPGSVPVWQMRKLEDWEAAMTRVFRELRRVVAPRGYIAFEVGEVRNGKVKLEESVVRVGKAAGLEPLFILINDQKFTKTSNCWGIENLKRGTNTNRIVLFRK